MNPEAFARMAQAAEMNRQRTGVLDGALDLRDIPWPADDLYGYNHSQEMSTLAHYIAEGLKVSAADLKALKLAGLLHDLGRQAPWGQPDPNHAQRSADLAGRFLRSQNETWFQHGLISGVEWMIAHHDLSAKELPTDPRLQALWDADSYEAARVKPGTPEGLKAFRTATSRLCTEWARDKENQRIWLRHRGWT